MRRTRLTVAIALVWLLATAPAASAHSVAGVGATNFQSRLKQIRPDVPGVDMAIVEAGSRFELTNTTEQDIVVLGYQDEPYLRVGPNGVFENRRSPAAYLNADRKGTTPVPGTADPKAEPDWEQVSGGQVARWHDHRIHWMGNQDPPAVRRQPGERHVVIPEWTIPMRLGSRTITATGDLLWQPGPSPLPWLAIALVLAVAVAGLALAAFWAPALAAVVGALVVMDVAHVIGVGFAKAGSTGTKIGQTAAGSFYSLVAWAAGVAAVWMLARRRPDGLFAAALAGLFIALLGGVVDLSDLTRSQVPFAWGATLGRVFVAVSLGAGLGLVAAAVIGLRRNPPPRLEAEAEAEPAPV